jgi:hypothetical protein
MQLPFSSAAAAAAAAAARAYAILYQERGAARVARQLLHINIRQQGSEPCFGVMHFYLLTLEGYNINS